MLAHLALPSIAMVEPLEEAFLMHELDAPAAGARVPQRVVGLAGVPADPAHVLLLLLVVVLEAPRLLRRGQLQ